MSEERVKRKLSAILSADVVGYSRLMQEDEVSTVRTLEAYRKVMSDLIEQFRGRVVDSPGDNLLSEFSSVVDAVQCAVEIHEVVRAKNEELPEERRMLFRIGVNLGDVIEEGDRIYGDGVNIAARLEGLAEAGGICISGSAHEQIENKLALGYEYLGEHTVKNIAKPVKVYRVPMGPKVATSKEGAKKGTTLKNRRWTALGAAGAIIVIIAALAIWNLYFRGPSIEPVSIESDQAPVVTNTKETPKTIAVLPFDDLSPEKDQEYFTNGLSEEILNSLTQIPGLLVTGRTSSFSFKGSNKKVPEIANELGVGNILEGSVRKAGNTLRITAQLLRGSDGFHLWSKTYDKDFKVEEMFSVQEDIAAAVANELKLTLGIKPLKQLGGTDNGKAYELYLVARGQSYRMEWNRALESFDAAIALDPNFALAWAQKADVHLYLALYGSPDRVSLEFDTALNEAQRAIELEPSLWQGYAVLGAVQVSKREFIEGELAFRKAMELTTDPISGLSPHYAMVGYLRKFHELLEEARRNDPIDRTVRAWYMLSLGLLGEMGRAEEEYERGKAIFGDQWMLGNLFINILRLGDKDVLSTNKTPIVPSFDSKWTKVFDNLESPEEGLAEVRQIYSNDDNLSSSEFSLIAILAAYFGDTELSLNAMERSVSLQAIGLVFYWAPLFHEVRQLPQYKEFVGEIGLVDYWNRFGWPDLCHPVGDDDFVCD
jgi:adenylate cyclase